MAIRKNKTTAPETAAETKDETVASEVPKEVKKETPKETPKAEAAPKETPAPVPSVAAPVGQLAEIPDVAPSLISLRDQFPGSDFGTNLPRLVPANAMVRVAGTKIYLGKFIDIQLISSSDRWMVTPVADNSDKEAKKFCRASYDGTTIPDRDGAGSETIEEYTSSVEEYEQFETKKYLDLFCIVINAGDPELQGKAVELGMVQISVSPTAIGAYRAFERQTPLSVARGVMLKSKQNCFRIVAEVGPGDFDYSIFTFSPVPHADIENYAPVSLEAM